MSAGACKDPDCRCLQVNKYMLFREPVEPDWHHELPVPAGPLAGALSEAASSLGNEEVKRTIAGGVKCRTILNAYEMSTSAGGVSLDKFTESVWLTLCYALIGEIQDPAECINGVWLEDRSNSHGGRGRGGGSKNAQLSVQVWFAVRDDEVCEAICERLRSVLNKMAEETRLAWSAPRFVKVAHLAKKHSVRVWGVRAAPPPLPCALCAHPNSPPPRPSPRPHPAPHARSLRSPACRVPWRSWCGKQARQTASLFRALALAACPACTRQCPLASW